MTMLPRRLTVASRINRIGRHLCATNSSSSLVVVQFPCLSDNYGYLLRDPISGETAAIDTPEFEPYISECRQRGWTLTHIFNTHWHPDHCGANDALREAFPDLKVYAPAGEVEQISKVSVSGVDVALKPGSVVSIGAHHATVMDVGFHTKAHIAYFFAEERLAFVGDALFALGCGRMFEGDEAQAWGSMQRIRNLPGDTTLYCAHEYTEANAKFVASLGLEDASGLLGKRFSEVFDLRRLGKPTVPSTLALEKDTNPFLRADCPDVRLALGMEGPTYSDAQVFGELRARKDRFK